MQSGNPGRPTLLGLSGTTKAGWRLLKPQQRRNRRKTFGRNKNRIQQDSSRMERARISRLQWLAHVELLHKTEMSQSVSPYEAILRQLGDFEVHEAGRTMAKRACGF